MRPLIILIALALGYMALSCKKEPITFAGEEELIERTRQQEDPSQYNNQTWMKFFGEVVLASSRIPIPVSEDKLEVRRPMPCLRYQAEGYLKYFGPLDEKLSTEAHYGPLIEAAPEEKNTATREPRYEAKALKYKVVGRFVNRKGEALAYSGFMTYYPDGRREGFYHFDSGTGRFDKIEGEFIASGKVTKITKRSGKIELFIQGKFKISSIKEKEGKN